MAASFKHLKHCDNKTMNLVHGFVHDAQRLLPCKQNSYFIIPEIIHHVCLSFYWIRFAFNGDLINKNLKVIDNKTITKVEHDGYAMCAVGKAISKDMCDIFRVEFHLKDYKDGNFCWFIGFCGLPFIDSTTKIDWKSAPGYTSNSIKSVGMCVYGNIQGDERNRTWIWRNMSKINGDKLCGDEDLKIGDKFMFEFNFIESKCHIYYNSKNTGCFVKFDYEQIIPLLTLYFVGEVIEITRYEFSSV